MISFDVTSLSPFDINFQEGLDKDVISLSPSGIGRECVWSLRHRQSNDKNVMLVEDKIQRVELDQKKHRIMWQTVFPVVKSVAPS